MKKFWKKTEGFTLVELIVVIAILGILAGVGTVGYSGYIKKANMAADQQLISSIENALTLAGYSGDLASGYVVLSATSAPQASGDAVAAAMEATLGAGWQDIAVLKYDGWGSNGLFDNLMPATADAVVKSSYLTGNRQDKLLTDVEILTGMSQKLVDFLDGTDDDSNKTFSDIFTKDGVCVLDETAAKYSITKGANESWEDWAAASPNNKAAYGNLLVMAAADEFEKYMSTTGTENEYQMTSASSTILLFSTYYAYAATDPEFSATLDQYMGHLNGTDTVPGLAPVENSSTGASWFSSLEAAANNREGYSGYASSQAAMDNAAFLSIMAGLGNPTEDQAGQIEADMTNPNLFTSGTVNGMYNDFITGAEAMAGMFDADDMDAAMTRLNLADGNVAVLFSLQGGAVNTMS